MNIPQEKLVREFRAAFRGPVVRSGDSEYDDVRTVWINYDRLVTIKNKYDPKNLFQLNPNIKPNGDVGKAV